MSNKPHSRHIDSAFGQAPAFGLDDATVNPLVIQYLKSVRTEALTTNATQSRTALPTVTVKHKASIYDDDGYDENDLNVLNSKNPEEKPHGDELITYISTSDKVENQHNLVKVKLPERLNYFNDNIESLMKWFESANISLKENAISTQDYTDDVLNLLLFYLKEFLENNIPNKKGISIHLVNLLKDHYVSEKIRKENAWIIDEEWVKPTLERLSAVRVRNIDDIKKSLTGNYYSVKPKNYNQWSAFLKDNEPNNSMFVTMMNQDDIWTIFKFMKQNWLKVIIKNPGSSKKMSMWLLYIMLYLPTTLSAGQVSTLRDFAKKCQKPYLEKLVPLLSQEPIQKEAIPWIINTTELKMLHVEQLPKDFTILELVLVIVSQKFGQKDLINWNEILKKISKRLTQ